jgi:hypothetical protein
MSINLSAGFANCNQPWNLQVRNQGAGFVMSVRRIVPIVLCVLLLGACEATQPATSSNGLTSQQFVELYVALRNAQNTARSTAELETMRRAIFDRAGVSPERMTQFVTEHGNEIEFMAAVWDSIKSRLDLASGLTPR